MRRPQTLATISLCAALFTASTAEAFCGFYVAGSDAALSNRATSVVLLRDGARTVLSMQNAYEGPPENFALVVPVPVVLQRENVRTLPREVFERVDRLAAPRLVEYWEQDPCREDDGDLRVSAASLGGGVGQGYGSGAGGLGVTVEAQFAVGEYDVVVLSATDSTGLETWLHRERYHIPASAAPVLAPYIRGGSKFFVARVDASRVTFENGRALLSPLRVHYDSDTFSLPIRLGLLNSPGQQELVVHVLARNQRYEVANRPNVFAPTNLDVRDAVRDRFGEFYNALFDREMARTRGAVLTEYAWQTTSCDPCPVEPLSESELATLGADVAPSLHGPDADLFPRAEVLSARVSGELPEAYARRVALRNIGQTTRCYEVDLVSNPTGQGTVTVRIEVDATGAVIASTPTGGTYASESLRACVAAAPRRWMYGGNAPARATIEQQWSFSRQRSPGRSRMWGRGLDWMLTRLHTRYGRDDVGEDLVFREAPPVCGGREERDAQGKLEPTRPATINNFQTRFSIRHPWTGPIACATPHRGQWGGPPGDTPRSPMRSAQNLAFAGRGLSVDAYLAPVTPPAPPTAPAATPPAGRPAAPAARSRGRFGCEVNVGATSDGPWGLALLALGALRRRRR